jgi:hypothetical protein
MNAIQAPETFTMQLLSDAEIVEVNGGLPQYVVVGAYIAGGLLGVAAVGVVGGLVVAYNVTH